MFNHVPHMGPGPVGVNTYSMALEIWLIVKGNVDQGWICRKVREVQSQRDRRFRQSRVEIGVTRSFACPRGASFVTCLLHALEHAPCPQRYASNCRTAHKLGMVVLWILERATKPWFLGVCWLSVCAVETTFLDRGASEKVDAETSSHGAGPLTRVIDTPSRLLNEVKLRQPNVCRPRRRAYVVTKVCRTDIRFRSPLPSDSKKRTVLEGMVS